MNITIKKNSSKTKAIFWAVLLIIGAGLLIASSFFPIKEMFNVSTWQLALGIVILVTMIHNIVFLKFQSVPLELALLFALFQRAVCGYFGKDYPMIETWIVIVAGIMLSAALAMLTKKFTVISCEDEDGKRHITSGSINNAENSMRSASVYLDASLNNTFRTENNLGQLTVYFENTEGYAGEGTLNIENNLGETVVIIPADWYLIVDNIDNSMGSVDTPSQEKTDGMKVLHAVIENNLGHVVFRIR